MSKNRTTAILFAALSGLLVAGALFLMRQSMMRQDTIEIFVLNKEVGAGDVNSSDLYDTRTVDPAGLANHPNPNLLRPDLTDMWVAKADGQLEAFYELEFTRSLSAGSVVDVAMDLGHAFDLPNDHRALALQVTSVTGLHGFIKRGDLVGVLAVLRQEDERENLAYAKMLFEDLTVMYVSPTFQRTLLERRVTVGEDGEGSLLGGGGAGGDEALADSGIVILSARIGPAPIIFKHRETMEHDWFEQMAQAAAAEVEKAGGDRAAWLNEEGKAHNNPFTAQEDRYVFASQIEALGMLQAADAQFTLVMQPQKEKLQFFTPGFSITSLLIPIQWAERELQERYGQDTEDTQP